MDIQPWASHIGVAIVGGLVVGLAVSTYFLSMSNDALQEKADDLQVKRDVLSGELTDVQAESIRLKEEALKNNVFLPK